MLDLVTTRWWVFLIRGIAAILFAAVAFVWPGLTLLALTITFGAYAFVDGVFAIVFAANGIAGSRWWVFLLEGLLGLVVAAFVFTQPAMSAVSLVYAIAFWAVFTGIIEIVAGIQLRDLVSDEWMYILAGILSITFGILVVRNPAAGALSIVWLIGSYSLLAGVLQIVLSYRLNHLKAATRSAAAT